MLGRNAGIHDDRGLVLALILCGKAVQRGEQLTTRADMARQNAEPTWKTALIRSHRARDKGTVVPFLLGPSEFGQIGGRTPSHIGVGQIVEDHCARGVEQLALTVKQRVFDGLMVFDQTITKAIKLVQLERLPGIETQQVKRGTVGLQPPQGFAFAGRMHHTRNPWRYCNPGIPVRQANILEHLEKAQSLQRRHRKALAAHGPRGVNFHAAELNICGIGDVGFGRRWHQGAASQFLHNGISGLRQFRRSLERHCQVIWRRLRLCVLRVSGGHLTGIILP